MKKCRKGQSTLEYVIILAAVIGAIILASVAIKEKVDASYTDLSGSMQTAVANVTPEFFVPPTE